MTDVPGRLPVPPPPPFCRCEAVIQQDPRSPTGWTHAGTGRVPCRTRNGLAEPDPGLDVEPTE